MNLPLTPPIRPMLAKRVEALPLGEGWLFEPKWDGFRVNGFRVIIFRDGREWLMQSRDLKPLNRYFPELEPPILANLPGRSIVDGELVIAGAAGLEFETLQQRIHPAESRVKLLAERNPASVVLWDLLALDSEDLCSRASAERREHLAQVLAGASPPLYLTPLTANRDLALDWFKRFEGAGLDGVMAKPGEGAYQPGKRSMLKVKHQRTIDVVLAGFRWHKTGPGTKIGSLLLGLYDAQGVLQHVGVAASFSEKRRRELAEELASLHHNALDGHPWEGWARHDQRVPGMTSRWSRGKTLEWEPLRPERVMHVKFDHLQGTRFCHTAHFLRWRPDKSPTECTYAQVDITPPYELERIFSQGS